MPESPLRGSILRLARQDPELRPKLIGILREAGELTEREAAEFLQPLLQPLTPPAEPPVVVNIVNNQNNNGGSAEAEVEAPRVAPAPKALTPAPAPKALTPNQSPSGVPGTSSVEAPVSSLFVPERAQQGFNAELVPEMNKLVASGIPVAQVVQEMLTLIEGSFAQKDSLYNILIRYQSSFESNAEYLTNIERMIEAWATSTSGV